MGGGILDNASLVLSQNDLDSPNLQSYSTLTPTLPKDKVRLEKSVVTASGHEQEYTLAPASIGVVTPQEIATRPIRDLSEAIQNIPGVSSEVATSNVGGYGISIRGLPTIYTLILIDGKRVNPANRDALIPNAGFGDTTASFMPPLSAIERIEVIRGPASTLYGSDALGGVVNIITKRSYTKWGASIGLDYTFQESKYFGDTQGVNFYTAGPLNDAKNWGLALRGRVAHKNLVRPHNLTSFPDNAEGTRVKIAGLTEGEQYNIGARLSWAQNTLQLPQSMQDSEYTPQGNPLNSIYVDVDYYGLFNDNSLGMIGNQTPSPTTNGYSKDYNIHRFNALLNHDGHYISRFSGILQSLHINNSLQYNLLTNPNRYLAETFFPAGTPSNANGLKQNNGVVQGDSRELKNTDIIAQHTTNMFFAFTQNLGLNATAGTNYTYNAFNDRAAQALGREALLDQHTGTIFGEGELMLYDRVFLTAGARVNYNSRYGINLSPRIYLSVNAIDDWLVIKGGVSSGYRAPNLSYLSNSVVNISGRGRNYNYGNENLKPETSLNYELSLISDNDYVATSLTGFFIDFKNRIDRYPTNFDATTAGVLMPNGVLCNLANHPGTNNNGRCNFYENVSRSHLYGLEISAELKPISVGYGDISLKTAYTLNKSEIVEAEDKSEIGLSLADIPLHNFNASLHYDSRYFGAYFRGEAKSGINRNLIDSNANQTLTNNSIRTNGNGDFYKPYYLLHLGLYIKPNKNIKLNFAAYNLLDFNFVDYFSYTTYSGTNGATQTPTYENNYHFIREGRRYFVSMQMDF
ncbi:TonB-dependent receptor domain-containing protein [Helicobacter sp. 23-1046]